MVVGVGVVVLVNMDRFERRGLFCLHSKSFFCCFFVFLLLANRKFAQNK